jgi:hypothetical protein
MVGGPDKYELLLCHVTRRQYDLAAAIQQTKSDCLSEECDA